jgi:hypothetical protein
MTCKCNNLPDVFYIEDAPNKFDKKFVEIDIGDWIRLYECPKCTTLWAIDEWDKYTWQIVFRILNRKNWESEITTEKRKQLLFNSRGGLTSEECIYMGCDKKRVKGVVYCIDHLYDTGARK